MTGDGWEIEWSRSWSEALGGRFEQRWSTLLDELPDAPPYHEPSLVRAWAETHGRAIGAVPRFGWAERGRERALLPWIVQSRPGRILRRRTLGPAGLEHFDSHDPLGAPRPDLWRRAQWSLRDDYDTAIFHFVHEGSAPAAATAAANEQCPVLRLPESGGLDELLAPVHASHRGDVRRQLRRLEAKGRVELDFPTGEAALRELHEGIEPAYRAIWGARPGGSQLDRPGVRAFVERVVSEGIAGGWSELAALRLDGNSIAWHLGFRRGRDVHWWLPTHAQPWEPYSPGKVLLALVLVRYVERGVRRVHFGPGAHAYKLAWQPELCRPSTVRFHSPTARGYAVQIYDKVWEAFRNHGRDHRA